MEDTVPALLHVTLTHPENTNAYARILLIDFSSAFNTILPQLLIEKLLLLGVDPGMCRWIMDILTERRQTVKNNQSEHRITTRMCTEPITVYAADA